MEEELKKAVNQVFVNTGNLLQNLNSSANQRTIPNPPGYHQAAIDNSIKQFHKLLDDIDAEIQLSRTQLRNMQIEREKAKKLAEEKATREREGSEKNKQEETAKQEEEQEEEQETNKEETANKSLDGDDNESTGTNNTTNNNNSNDDNNNNDDDNNENNNDTATNNDDKNNETNNTNGEQNGQEEKSYPANNMEFDDDLNALLGSVGQPDDQDIGLFGDDFDFVLPGQ